MSDEGAYGCAFSVLAAVRMETSMQFLDLARPFMEKEGSLARLNYFVTGALAGGTQTKYYRAWERFKAWLPHGVDVMQCNDFSVSLYLADLIQDCVEGDIGPQKVKEASAAISYYFHMANKQSPSEGRLCSLLKKSAEKMLFAQKLDRQPLLVEDMKLLLDFHLNKGCSLRVRMHLTVLLVMFLGCLRFDDVQLVLVHSDLLQFVYKTDSTLDGVLIFLPRGKTDGVWHGSWCAIGATGGEYCPVKLLQELLSVGKYVTAHDTMDCGPLLRAVKWNSKSQSHVLQQIIAPFSEPIPSLSDTTLRNSLKLMTAEAGIVKNFGLHGARIGFASEASLIPGIEPRLILSLGRWKHGNTMDDTYARILEVGYQKLFEVTRALWKF